MAITLTVLGADVSFEVVGELDDGHLFDFEQSLDWAVQQVRPISALSGKAINRGTAIVSEVFRVDREHSTEGEAQFYLRTLPETLPTGPELYAYLKWHDGEELYMANCAITITAGSQIGVRSMITYQLQGGLWTRNNLNES